MFRVAAGMPLNKVSPSSMKTRLLSSSTAASSEVSAHFPCTSQSRANPVRISSVSRRSRIIFTLSRRWALLASGLKGSGTHRLSGKFCLYFQYP